MQSSTRRPLRRARRALLLITVATVVATLAAPSAAAVSVRRAWKAQLGGNGANGTATLTAYWTGNGAMTLKLVGLQPSTTYPIIAYRGSCAKPTLITRLPGAVTDANGTATKTYGLSGFLCQRATEQFPLRFGARDEVRAQLILDVPSDTVTVTATSPWEPRAARLLIPVRQPG